MQTGKVKWFNDQKGFGFIQPEDGGQDVFVHISAVERAGMRTLREGQRISFDLQNDPKSRKTSAHNLQDPAKAANEDKGAADEDDAEEGGIEDEGDEGEGDEGEDEAREASA